MWNSTWIACMLTAGLLVSQQTPYERSDGSWLDAPMGWNQSPIELLRGQPEGPNPKCDPTVRAPQSAAERLLTAAGWKLTISEVKRSGGHSIEIVQAFRQFDGMCRDLQAQAFVFVNDRLVGTLSPRLMNARALARCDGSAHQQEPGSDAQRDHGEQDRELRDALPAHARDPAAERPRRDRRPLP